MKLGSVGSRKFLTCSSLLEFFKNTTTSYNTYYYHVSLIKDYNAKVCREPSYTGAMITRCATRVRHLYAFIEGTNLGSARRCG